MTNIFCLELCTILKFFLSRKFFQENVSLNPFLIQHDLCARSALSFGQHSPHNNLRDSPEAFSRVYDHHRGWKAVNIPARQPDISPDLRIHRSKSRICQNVRCSSRWILYSSRPGGAHTLPKLPLELLWELCRSNWSAERPQRFLKHAFLVTDLSLNPDLVGSC